MNKIVKGYWDCPYCDSKGLDGLIDNCPNCGKQKPQDTKYYMKSGIKEYVSETELNAAGITLEECDGNHPDWICNFCNQLNDDSEEYCVACGAPKTSATHTYGQKEIKPEIPDTTKTADIPKTSDTDFAEYEFSVYQKDASESSKQKSLKDILRKLPFLQIFSILALFCFIAFLFWPVKYTVTVNGFSWMRNIYIQEEQTFKENGWSVPANARVYNTTQEIKSYVSILDHYETVPEIKTRQVLDHYDTEYYYRDNGNGTFTEISNQVPVYRTETYTDYVEKPVYRDEPVYATKYYYEIDRWMVINTITSSGNDKNPYWETDYEMRSDWKDDKRSEQYCIHYDNNDSIETDYENWLQTEVGDQCIITKCRLGIIYNTTYIK